MTRKIDKNLLMFGLPLLLLAALILLAKSATFQTHPRELSLGITLDLVITLPVVYGLAIRNTTVPKITILSVFLIGLFLAGWILPVEHQNLLAGIKSAALPIAEIGIVSFLLLRTRLIVKSFKEAGNQTTDFFDTLKLACSKVLPARVGQVLAMEIAVVYYSFFSPWSREIRQNEYTYYKKSGVKAAVGVFLFLVAIETFVIHILVERWNVAAAYILTFLSLYTCLQMFALLRSMNQRLISIDKEEGVLRMKYGFFNHTEIPLDQIENIELNSRSLPAEKSMVAFSPLGILDHHNIVIKLADEQTLHQLYGFQKSYRTIAVYIDEKEKFVQEIKSTQGKTSK